jgi:hypothetical protein
MVCLVPYTIDMSNTNERETMNTKTFTAYTYSCETCNWEVPMIFEQGAISAYVTNKSLRDLRKHAEGRDVDEAPALGNYCLTCNTLAAKS